MSNKRYCNNCKWLTERTGYCFKLGLVVSTEKVTNKHIRAITCILERYKQIENNHLEIDTVKNIESEFE